jgi:hypothetical protein
MAHLSADWTDFSLENTPICATPALACGASVGEICGLFSIMFIFQSNDVVLFFLFKNPQIEDKMKHIYDKQQDFDHHQ